MESIMTIRAPDELQALLAEAAKNLGLTRNAFVLQVLWDWINANQNQKGA